MASRTRAMPRNIIIVQEALGPWLPSRVNRRCPATILAANRTERVRGRIILLTNSISTIKGIKGGGVPSGTKWASILWGVLIHPIVICPTHKGKAILIVNVKCLLEVKIKGKSPQKLFKAINTNKTIGKKVKPGAAVNPTMAWNSLCNDRVNLFMFSKIWVEASQNAEGISLKIKNLLNQFILSLRAALGSKTEKRLDIIKNIF